MRYPPVVERRRTRYAEASTSTRGLATHERRRLRVSRRSTSPTKMNTAVESACSTSAYDSASESAMPYAPSATTVAASNTPSAEGGDGTICTRFVAITTSSAATSDRPRSKLFITNHVEAAIASQAAVDHNSAAAITRG